MSKLKRRYMFDIVISVLLIIEMFFEVTGDFPHEILGCIFFVTIILHLILSRKWMSVTARQVSSDKKMKMANKIRLFLAIGLAVSFVALAASSVAISLVLINLTGVNLAGDARETWVIVHAVSSYALCIFTIAHVLVHWASIFSTFKIPYNPARRQAINTGASAIVAVSAVALGISGAKTIDSIVNPIIEPEQEEAPLEGAPQEEEPPELEKPTEPENATAPQSGQSTQGTAEKSTKAPESSSSSSKPQSSQPAPEKTQPSTPKTEQSQPPASNNSSGDSGSSQNNNSTSKPSGVCTLCKKRCPLSAPKCNKPYQAGLI